MSRNFYILAYDIADNSRRQKIAKACESIADRVQESVFEAYLNAGELKKLVAKTTKLMKKEEDSLRVYLVCSACRGKASVYGQGRLTPEPGVTIV